MKKSTTKLTALALAAAMSFSSFVAVPATAIACPCYAAPARRAITNYYDYADWRLNELDRLYDELGNMDYDSETMKQDRKNVDLARQDVRNVRSDYNWARWNPYLYQDVRYGLPGYSYWDIYSYDRYYYDYIDAVDNIVNICINKLSKDAKNHWDNYINVDYWGYNNWNDYYNNWYSCPASYGYSYGAPYGYGYGYGYANSYGNYYYYW